MSIGTIIIIVVISNIVIGGLYSFFRSEPEEEKLRCSLANNENKAKEMERRYEQQLAEANERIKALEEMLKAVAENGADNIIKQQQAEKDNLKKKLKEQQDKIEEYKKELDDLRKKLKNQQLDNLKQQDELGQNFAQQT